MVGDVAAHPVETPVRSHQMHASDRQFLTARRVKIGRDGKIIRSCFTLADAEYRNALVVEKKTVFREIVIGWDVAGGNDDDGILRFD